MCEDRGPGLAVSDKLPHHGGKMREWADFTLESGDSGKAVLALKGPLRVHSLGNLDAQLDALEEDVGRVDLAQVTEIDTTGE